MNRKCSIPSYRRIFIQRPVHRHRIAINNKQYCPTPHNRSSRISLSYNAKPRSKPHPRRLLSDKRWVVDSIYYALIIKRSSREKTSAFCVFTMKKDTRPKKSKQVCQDSRIIRIIHLHRDKILFSSNLTATYLIFASTPSAAEFTPATAMTPNVGPCHREREEKRLFALTSCKFDNG